MNHFSQSSPFQNRHALVVGGTSGIGLATAIALNQAGAKVAVVGKMPVHNQEQQLASNASAALPNSILQILSDVTLRHNWLATFNSCLDHFNGRLDILVNTVGGSARSSGDGPLDQCTESGWNAALRLNLDTAFFVLQSGVLHMAGQTPDRYGQRGMIAMTGSVLADHPAISYFNTVGYAVAKAGLEALVLNTAAAYAAQGIRVNLLKPGLVRTPMAQRALENDQITSFLEQKQPLTQGPVSAEACAQALLGLISPLAVGLTGALLTIDGGWSIN